MQEHTQLNDFVIVEVKALRPSENNRDATSLYGETSHLDVSTKVFR